MGDDPGFDELATALAPALFRTAWLLTGDRHRAEDLVQEALVALYLARERRTPVEHPLGFARTVLVRTHVSGRRRRSSTERPTDFTDPAGSSDLAALEPVLDWATAVTLRRAVAELGPRDQAVLVLRFYCDRSVADTAVDLGISEVAVRARTSRATARLRQLLTEDDHDRRTT